MEQGSNGMGLKQYQRMLELLVTEQLIQRVEVTLAGFRSNSTVKYILLLLIEVGLLILLVFKDLKPQSV